MFETEKQDETQELSEVGISNLPDKEFKIMIIKMLKELRRRMVEQSEKIEFLKQRVRK